MSEVSSRDGNSEVRVRAAASGFVSLLGVAFLGVHVVHLLEEEGIVPLVIGVGFPSVFAVFLVYAGYRLLRSDLGIRETGYLVAWTLVGGAVVGVFLVTALVYNASEGGDIRHPVFLLVNSVNVGTVAGFGVGWYYAQENHQIRLLREKQSDLSQQRRINEVMRRVSRGIFRSETRDEIESKVCEALTDADPYVFAWIGRRDPETDEVVPTASAGLEKGYLDEIEVYVEGEKSVGPTGGAFETHDVEVTQNIPEDPRYEPWRDQAFERGYMSSASVPLVYRDEIYGVLNLYADRSHAFDDEETEMLTDLGNDIGYSIDSIRTRRRLRETRRKLEKSQEIAQIGHWEYDPETGETDWSEKMFRILGADPEETSPTYDALLESVHPDDRERLRKTVESEPEDAELDYRVRHPDGSIRVVQQTTETYTRSDGETEVFGTVQDVTRERRTQSLLNSIRSIGQRALEAETEEEILRSTVEILSSRGLRGYGFGCVSVASLDDGAVEAVYDAGRIAQDSTERWREIYTDEYIEEVIETGTLRLDNVTQPPYEHHEDRDSPHGAVSVALEYRNRCYGVMTLHVPQEISDDKVRLIEEIANDVSAGIYSIRAEERLEREKDEFALLNRIVRHDIRNDMNLVLGWGDVLRDHVDEDGEEHLETVLRTSEHVVDLTRTARDFVRAVEEGEEMNLRPLSLSSTLEKTVESRRQTYTDAEFVVDDLPDVEVEANDLLSTVFRNLLNNAVQHNDSEEPRVVVSAEETDGEVVVSVADNGPGVPDSQKDEIFGRGEKGLESEGTGVGLYLVHRLVEEYGGEIWVEDNQPEGAVFNFELDIV